jgi:abequosyltransferase
MNKLLTIAIPTFNRAEFLEKQLSWLAKAIQGFESECEIIISDNFSIDHTQEVIQQWEHIFQNTIFKSIKQNENIGLMPNLAYCINAATSKYVWVIGDDDPIEDNALAYAVGNLKTYPDLSLLILNFSCFYVGINQLAYERCFDIKDEEVRSDGKVLIENCLQENFSGLAFMTAQIYQTQAAQQALKEWPLSQNNREGQVYWTAFCGTKGSVKITKKVYLQYACGMNSAPDIKQWFKMRYSDLPVVYTKLMKIGYGRRFCRKLIIKHFTENNFKVILGALKRWPIFTINTIVPYLSLVGISSWKMIFSSKNGMLNSKQDY